MSTGYIKWKPLKNSAFWSVLKPEYKLYVSEKSFGSYIFKINGVIYTKYSEEFMKIYEQEWMWENLKDGH